MSQPCLGTLKIAIFPINRLQIDNWPLDWRNEIQQRFNGDPNSPFHRIAVRDYITRTSYQRADVNGVIHDMVNYDGQDVPNNLLSPMTSKLIQEGFQLGILLILDHTQTTNELTFWRRLSMRGDFAGWAKMLVEYWGVIGGLDNVDDDLGFFDNLAAPIGTHTSAFTKREIRWVDDTSVARHTDRTAIYDLHTLSFLQPPPPGKVTAVQVGENEDYFMVESRERFDEFDGRPNYGIPSEGVIVYNVERSGTTPPKVPKASLQCS